MAIAVPAAADADEEGRAEVGCSVQEAAERTGLSVHTLRYYEREGLIPSVGRDAGSGHRRYTERDLSALDFLNKLRLTGMPIREMQRFTALYRDGDASLPERRRMLEERRCAVLARIEELQSCLRVLDYKIDFYNRLGAERNWTGDACEEKQQT